jgi:outer membrane protein OmpA-like peptidoglycan-associated protein
MAVTRSIAAAAVMALALGGCSSIPDAANPVEWYRSASGWVSSEKPVAPSPNATDDKMKAAQAQGTPNLASVPERPARASTPAERQALTQGLIADRENARYTDDDLQPAAQRAASAPTPAAAPAPAPAARMTAVPAAPAAPAVVPPAPPSPTPLPTPAAAPPPVAPAPSAPPSTAPAAESPVQPVPPPPAPNLSSPARAAGRPSVPPPSAAPRPEAPPPPPVMPPARMSQAQPVPAAPQSASAPSVDQVYRQQLTRSEAVTQLRPPVAEPPMPPPAEPRRIGALQHTAREGLHSQVAYIGGAAPAPQAVLRPGDPIATIPFASGSARLSRNDRDTLARVAAMAREFGGRVRVVGHAGRAGGDGAKDEVGEFGLSLDRANIVAAELINNGLAAEGMRVEALGGAEPLVIAGDAAAEAPNRRAEVYFD